jgi:phosphoribosylformylglycinamidine synthase
MKKRKDFLYRFFKIPLLSDEKSFDLLNDLQRLIPDIKGIQSEGVFYVESNVQLLGPDIKKLRWFLREKGEDKNLSRKSFIGFGNGNNVINVAPRLSFETSFSTNAVSICHSGELPSVTRLEPGRRYKIIIDRKLTTNERSIILPLFYDKMTESVYPAPLSTFRTNKKPEPVKYINVMGKGIDAIKEANRKLGTGMDEIDMNYFLYLFKEVAKRNPTDAEFLDLGNSFSEHSRHHIFRAKLIIDGHAAEFTLMELIKSTLKNSQNSVIAFHDNASAIQGVPISVLVPERPGLPSAERMATILYHYVLTCETHNHPCLWAAYPGAATGAGGRRRDNQAVGRGGIVCAASAGFLGGNLQIPGYRLPWENEEFIYDPRVESPLNFFIKATKGAFDDGNQFGEPVTLTFAESFGMIVGKNRWEFIKPVMFVGGYSFINDCHIEKHVPKKGWLVVKLGGKAYLIGMGGGAGSSVIQGEHAAELDFNSVQRNDGEMARKTDEVLRTCIYMGKDNPIESMSDQGAGGFLNVVKELIYPAGAEIKLRKILLGDKTLSVSEILVAEHQESLVLLIKPERIAEFVRICEREKCPHAIVGTITGDGRAIVIDEKDNTTPVDLDLGKLFEEYPQKTFTDSRQVISYEPLSIPDGMTVKQALELVPRLLGVTSKEWMHDIVDSSVTGKVVQGPRIGSLGLPLSQYSLIAPSFVGHTGEINSVAQRPSIGLISSGAMSRMVPAEALLKLMFAPVSNRNEIKASANWMLAAKLSGGLAWLYDAALALKDFLNAIGVDIDGGKDSLSLAARVPGVDGETQVVRSPSTLVFSTYAACTDYRLRVNAAIEYPGESRLMFVDLADGFTRLGGSALAQTLKQVGNEAPDVDSPEMLISAFDCVQKMVKDGLIKSGRVRTRGGLIHTLNKMAYAGNCGIEAALSHSRASEVEMFFNEELGFVIEYLPRDEEEIQKIFNNIGLGKAAHFVGVTSREKRISITYNGRQILNEDMRKLMATWRDTSFQLKALHSTKSSVRSERSSTYNRIGPAYRLSFDPDKYAPVMIDYPGKVKVAIIRDEGTNSHEEARDACYLAGFQPHVIHLTDIAEQRVSLREFRGVVNPGGFSYKDVLGSAKGVGGVIKFNNVVMKEFEAFFKRADTFSVGFCNGCQLMILLGMVPWEMNEEDAPKLVVNSSESFESRFPAVRIYESPAIMLKGMEGSVLGVHASHGEGKFIFPNPQVLNRIVKENLAPIRFVDDYGEPTEIYPLNPNGSQLGITALCDPTGRHLAFMEHPERTVLKRQWSYWPHYWESIKNSPWLKMFQNAREWCEGGN